MTPSEQAKRQAYSFNFPPDKKEKFAALARSMNRPMAWLLLEAIDRMIECGGTYPVNAPQIPSPIGGDVLEAYVSKSDMPKILKEYILSTDQVTEIAREEAYKLTQPIVDELLELRGQISPQKLVTDGRIEFATFTQTHGLDIKRGVSAGDIRSALEKAGLSDRYRYDSTVRAFYPC